MKSELSDNTKSWIFAGSMLVWLVVRSFIQPGISNLIDGNRRHDPEFMRMGITEMVTGLSFLAIPCIFIAIRRRYIRD